MDDDAFRRLITRDPFGECSNPEWRELTAHLMASFSRFLGVPLEFFDDCREPDGDNFAPLVRSRGDVNAALGLRIGGMIACSTHGQGALRVDGLLFLFAHGERVAPPDRLFLTYGYRGPVDGVEWVPQGWKTDDFEDAWEPYTYNAFFG